MWLFAALIQLIIVCYVNSRLLKFGFSSPRMSPHHKLPADNAPFDRSRACSPMDNCIASECLIMDGIDRYTSSLGCVVFVAVLSRVQVLLRALFDRSGLLEGQLSTGVCLMMDDMSR